MLVLPPKPRLSFDASSLFKVVIYRSAGFCKHKLESVTIGGQCYIGDTQVLCKVLSLGGVGPETLRLIPWLRAAHQIFYTLVFFRSVLVILFHQAVNRKWATARDLGAYRRFITVTDATCFVAGLVAMGTSFGMMLPPAIHLESNGVMDVDVGWGQAITFGTVVLIGFLAVGFRNESRRAIDDTEGSIALVDEEEVTLLEDNKPTTEIQPSGRLADV